MLCANACLFARFRISICRHPLQILYVVQGPHTHWPTSGLRNEYDDPRQINLKHIYCIYIHIYIYIIYIEILFINYI